MSADKSPKFSKIKMNFIVLWVFAGFYPICVCLSTSHLFPGDFFLENDGSVPIPFALSAAIVTIIPPFVFVDRYPSLLAPAPRPPLNPWILTSPSRQTSTRPSLTRFARPIGGMCMCTGMYSCELRNFTYNLKTFAHNDLDFFTDQ